MYYIIGVMNVLGILAEFYDLIKKSKVYGIIQLILAVIFPIITLMYCSLKKWCAFGGSDLEFLIHSAALMVTRYRG